MLEELMDRFGEPPRSVQNLLSIANLKAIAHRCYFTEVAQKGDFIRFTMFEHAIADPVKIEELVKRGKGRLKFIIDTNPYFLYSKPRKNGNDNQDVLYVVGELLKEFQALVPKEACEKSV